MSVTGDVPDRLPRRILSSISSGVGGTVAVSVLGAVAVRMITTHLGASNYGIFVVAQAFVSLAWNFTDLGLSQVLPRDIARGDRDERWLLGNALGLRVTLALAMVPIAIVIALLVYAHRSETLKIAIILLLLSVPFAVSQEVSSSHFTASLRNTILAIGGVLQQVVFVGLVILAVESGKSIVYCVGAALLGAVVAAAYTFVAARREVRFTPTFDKATWRAMLRTSTPIGLAYIIGSLYLRADTLILSFLSTAKQIGYYGVAYAIIAVFLVLPSILTRTFVPLLVRADDESLGDTVNSSLGFFAIGGVLSATGVMVCAPTVVRLVSGPAFGPAVFPLRILGLGLIFIFMTTGLSSICLARGYTSKLFLMGAISLVLNVILNIAAIPRFGIDGAATATLVCEVFSMAFMTYLVVSEVKVRPNVVATLARPLLAGVVTCAVLAPIYVRPDLGVGVGLALIPGVIVIYVVILAALRGIPAELRSALRSVRFGGK
jgi:O-antigen/teichoic acid export membrane protein